MDPIDKIVLKYLEIKGYNEAAISLRTSIKEEIKSEIETNNEIDEQLSMDEIRKEDIILNLTAESNTGKNILFYGISKGDPQIYDKTYIKLLDWIVNSLDMYKMELFKVVFPIFVHCYLELISKNFTIEGSDFFSKYSNLHKYSHINEIRKLCMILKPEHLQSNEYAVSLLNNKFQISMSTFSFELLNSFLINQELFLLLSIINERVHITLSRKRPDLMIQEINDESENISKFSIKQMKNILAKRQDKEPDISISMADLEKNEKQLENYYQSKILLSESLKNINDIPISWSIYRERKFHLKENKNVILPNKDENPANSTQSKDEKEIQQIEKDRKHKKIKANIFKEMTIAPLAKISTDAMPDYTSPLNTEILEKLVLRQPEKRKLKELEDSRRKAKLWKSMLPSSLCFTFFGCYNNLTTIKFSTDGSLVSTGYEDSSIIVWKNKKKSNYKNDEKQINVKASDNNVKNQKTKKERYPHNMLENCSCMTLRGHSGSVYSIDISSDNRFLLSSSADTTIRLWSLKTESNITCYRGHNYPVWDIDISNYGYYFLSCSMDKTARLWSIDRNFPLRIFAGHFSDVDSVKFHPNSNYVATGSTDKMSRIWDLQSGKCVRILTGHDHPIKQLAFSPNGKLLATAGDDLFINIYDISTGKRLDTLLGHTSKIHSLDFSQEGNILASGSEDTTVRLWSVDKFGEGDSTNILNQNYKINSRVKKLSPTINYTNSSNSLVQTFYSKNASIYNIQFTTRNLLLVGGMSKSNSVLYNTIVS